MGPFMLLSSYPVMQSGPVSVFTHVCAGVCVYALCAWRVVCVGSIFVLLQVLSTDSYM